MIEPNPLTHVPTTVAVLTYLIILATGSITFYRFSVPRGTEPYFPNIGDYIWDIRLILWGLGVGILSLTIVLGLQLIVPVISFVEVRWPMMQAVTFFYFIGISAIKFITLNLLILLLRRETIFLSGE